VSELEVNRELQLPDRIAASCSILVAIRSARKRYSGSLLPKTNKNSGIASLFGLLPSGQWR